MRIKSNFIHKLSFLCFGYSLLNISYAAENRNQKSLEEIIKISPAKLAPLAPAPIPAPIQTTAPMASPPTVSQTNKPVLKPIASTKKTKTASPQKQKVSLSKNPSRGLASSFGSIQAVDRPKTAEALTLQSAIDRAFSTNRSILAGQINLKNAEIYYNNAWDTMYMPNINLVYNSTSNLTVGHIPGQLHTTNGNNQDSHGYPTQNLGLQLGQYTLFNFWRDYDTYEQARLDWKRTKEQFQELKRSVRNQVIIGFYRYFAELEKLDAARRSVAIAEAFVEVLKSRAKLGKATESEVSSSEVDLLNARNNYNSQNTSSRAQLWNLNQVLGDPIDTPYEIKEKAKFIPLKLKSEEALKIYFENAPNIKDRRKDITKAELALDLAQKSRLPLPRVVFSGVTVGVINSYNQVARSYDSTSGQTNLDISAQVNLTLPLLGPGGFLNGRTIDLAQLSLDQADLAFQTTVNADHVSIMQTIQQILQAEASVQNNRESFTKSNALLEQLSSQISAGSISRLELRDAINQSRSAELQLNDSIIQHLEGKLNLALLIGVDSLPGDQY